MDDNAYIQAMCSIGSLILTMLTFGLGCFSAYLIWRYTKETIDIRKSTFHQSQAAIRPALEFEINNDVVVVENVGGGPAVNVYWRYGFEEKLDYSPKLDGWNGTADFNAGIKRGISDQTSSKPELVRLLPSGLSLRYQDLADKWYSVCLRKTVHGNEVYTLALPFRHPWYKIKFEH